MKAGDLDRRIEVLDPVEGTRTGSGAIPVSWVPATAIGNGDGKVWANVRPVAGQKYFSADQINSRVSHTILVRYQHGFRSNQHVRHETEPGKFQTFEIESVLPLEMDRSRCVLMCVLRESDGFR